MIIWYLILTVICKNSVTIWIVLKIGLVNSIFLILPICHSTNWNQELSDGYYTYGDSQVYHQLFGCEMSSFRIGFQHKLPCQLKGQLVFDWKQFWRVKFFSARACPCTLIIDFQLCTSTPKLYYNLLAILPLEMLLNRLKHPYFQVAYILKVYNIHNCWKLFVLFV